MTVTVLSVSWFLNLFQSWLRINLVFDIALRTNITGVGYLGDQ